MPPRRAAAVKARESVASATATATATAAPKRSSRSQSRRVVSDDEHSDDDVDIKPSRRAPARKAAPKKSVKRVESSDEDEPEDDSQDEADEVDDSLLVANDDDDDDDEDEENEQVTPTRKKSKSPPPSAKTLNKPAKRQVQIKHKVPESEQDSDAESDHSQASFKEAPESTPPREPEPEPEPREPLSEKQDNVPQTPSNAVLQQLATPKSVSIAAPVTPAGAGPGPQKRLVIHKMVLHNFKSYAGTQEIGPFHKSFSSVVGPNGSGKSNVIDSLLFVFGWRANKMRQAKLSELIHNSAGRENLPSCSVEVWFREIIDLPGEAYKVVPNSKLIVARTAFRNNSSQYTINNRKSTFTEVTTLLKGRGIDLDHKRFLILQGEVESIAQMPPKAKNEHEEGLLEYLEDIIGTSQFKGPIEEQAKLVDEANERRAEKLGRLKIVQKEKDALQAKKRQAEEYLRDQNELTQRQSALWQVYILECRDQMHVASKAIESLKKRIEQETEKNAGSKAEIEQLEAEYQAIVKDFDAIAKSTDKVVRELAKYEKEDVQLQEKKKHLEGKKKKCKSSISNVSQSNHATLLCLKTKRALHHFNRTPMLSQMPRLPPQIRQKRLKR